MKLSHLLPAALTGAGLIQATVIPVPASPYKVQWTSTELVDPARPDPFNATHPRRIMISRFTPVRTRDCQRTCRVPYMNAFMSSVEDAIIDAFVGSDIGWPHGVLGRMELEVCCAVRTKPNPPKPLPQFPTILYGTGRNTSRLLYSAAAQHLASAGYEVVVMDHPYETDAVQFPDGSVIYGGRVPRDPEAVEALAAALDVRSKDAGMVLDYLGVPRGKGGKGTVGFVGDSFGGPAAADVMLKDGRVGAGVNMDGMMFGPAVEEGVQGPFLTFGSPGHNSSSDETWERFFNATRTKYPRTWLKELSVEDSAHGLLIDFGLVADVADLRGDDKQVVGNLVGVMTGARTIEILRAYLSDFFEFTLGGKGQGLLAGPSKKYSEVLFL
ncbi:hypothetical protein CHGG_07403 [Chaetomium globosum CBS 148.51]|uniref:1-alkyl-2-acetylglycerophosphocholine esterase n=1 Tax=Chaetomium globosum (strain ATCC 6205 / CBS 148.51 / DSM 1962 / NBRC 6347 / NRRL 1970) TaxID=306901 RepID=Q2GXA1_CHAGB|nr:uncharacterized protein CHGG_07403 [Chaetomium globosum CBS 148.51]EAQ86150.1 hypothetical protein CHGG_07403 [Chaetomium globosum CBS 148.51]